MKKLNWINAGDKDEDVTAVHLEEGSDVKKFTHEEQTDKDLTRMKSHRGTTLINPVMFFPKALSFVFCLVLSVVAAKNVMVSCCPNMKPHELKTQNTHASLYCMLLLFSSHPGLLRIKAWINI